MSKMNDALPIISLLTLVFSLLLISEILRLRKVQRRQGKKIKYLQQDIDKLKNEKSHD